MSAWTYRLLVLGSALAWLLVGLHLPALHQITHHGRPLQPAVVLAVAALVLLAIGGVWALLRAPTRLTRAAADGVHAP